MKLSGTQTKVTAKQSQPQILIRGNWLTELGFEINRRVEIKRAPLRLILSAIHKDRQKLIPDAHHKALVDAQRFEAYRWLKNQSVDYLQVHSYLKEIENSQILCAVAFDLVYILLQADLLAG